MNSHYCLKELSRDVLATRDFHARAGQQAREDKTATPCFSVLKQRLNSFLDSTLLSTCH